MKNYQNYNQYTTSKAYYSDLKNSNKNLNSSKYNIDKLEKGLQKILHLSYDIFNPLFKAETNIEYKARTIKEQEIDNDFDEKLKALTPSWLLKVFNLLLLIYQKLIGKKLAQAVKLIKKIIKPTYSIIAQKIKEKKEILRILSLKYIIKTKPT